MTSVKSPLSVHVSAVKIVSVAIRVLFGVLTVFSLVLREKVGISNAFYVAIGFVLLLPILGVWLNWLSKAKRLSLLLKPEAASLFRAELAKLPALPFIRDMALLWFVWGKPHLLEQGKKALEKARFPRSMSVALIAFVLFGASALPIIVAFILAVYLPPFVAQVSDGMASASGVALPITGVQPQMTSAKAAVQHSIPASPVTPQSTPLFKAQPNVVQRRGQKPSGDDFVIWRK